MAQPLTYTKGKVTNLNCYFTWKISGGSFVGGATGDKPACASPAALAPIIAALSPPKK